MDPGPSGSWSGAPSKRVLWPWIAIAAGAALAVLLAVLIIVIALVP